MLRAKNIIEYALSSSLTSLSDWYDFLSDLPYEQRLLCIKALKDKENEIKVLIQNPQTQAELSIHAKYMYFWRFKYKLKEPDYFLKSGFEHLVYKLEASSFLEEKFRDFCYNTPSEEEFTSFFKAISVQVTFSEIVSFLLDICDYHYSDATIDEWFEKKFIYTDESDYRYQSALEDAQKIWFFREKAVSDIKNKWRKIWENNKKAKADISILLSNYCTSGRRLKKLVEQERNSFLRLYYAEQALDALDENVKKKHLLAEDALKSIEIYKELTKYS